MKLFHKPVSQKHRKRKPYSNIDIREQYTDIQHHNHETWKAFLRRINTIKVFTQNDIKEYTVKDYFDAFRYLTEKELQEIPFDNHKDGK